MARRFLLIALALACAAGPACEGTIVPPPCCTGPSDTETPVLIGAGDIAECNSPGSEATAILLGGYPKATVFTAGDNAYPSGSVGQFRDCYEPTWGRHKARTRPTAGNHDYDTPNASAYYDYFGDRAGPRGLGYYTYSVGTWRVIALNSEISKGPGSTQMQWLEQELRNNPVECTIAIWHRPLFSSSRNGPNPDMREAFRLLAANGAEIVINGHDHVYERFALQDQDGRRTTTAGVRQFTVGTGGVALYEFQTPHPNSEVRIVTWGLLKLDLRQGAYDWQFIAVNGTRDSGSGACR
jgi:hypothetical protein